MTTITKSTLFGMILLLTLGSSLGSDDNTIETIWPSFGCHQYYNNNSDFLPKINEKCANGSKYREEIIKKEGYSIILDQKACIAQAVGIVYLPLDDVAKTGGFIYNGLKNNGLRYMLSRMFGTFNANSTTQDDAKKQDEYFLDLVERGKICDKRLAGKEPSDEYWGPFYKCLDNKWDCEQIRKSIESAKAMEQFRKSKGWGRR